jgi:hypothetical protein
VSDISKCRGDECEIRDRCRRFTDRPSERQAWVWPKNRGENCEYFLHRNFAVSEKERKS